MLNLDKNKKYVVACSFGPDSMALLSMAIFANLNIVVAHVNYHKRDVSNKEEESLRKFCKDHNLEIEVLDTATLKQTGNFQQWARNIRYEFFKKVLLKHSASAVLVAHQQDDVIETYIMQKKRGIVFKNAGIAEKTIIGSIEIIRPLLSYSKKDLLDYDIENKIPFSIDESNLADHYFRNSIRHHIVEKLSNEERNNILKEIEAINKKQIEYKTKYSLKEFLGFSKEDILFLISDFIEKSRIHKDLSMKFVDEIIKAFESKKSLVEINLYDSLFISKEYNYVYLLDKNKIIKYEYILNVNDVISDELFDIDFSEHLDRGFFKGSFPISIKPVSMNESIVIKDYSCKINRLFIDWKMPHHLRNIWPGIYDSSGKLIYVPRYREKFLDTHSSKFVIKFVF